MKKLERIRDFLVENDLKLSSLKRLGFICRRKDSASGKIWVSLTRKIVVKIPVICNKRRISHPYAIPTLAITIPRGRYASSETNTVYIQPFANTKNTNLAYIRLHDKGYDGDDFKRANLAWYKNQPVLIDW